MTISEKLSKYAADFTIDSVSPEAVAEASRHFADTIACMTAGASSDTVAKIESYAVNNNGGHPESTILGFGGAHCKAAFAAMVNAASAHCRDFDDMSVSLNGHASAVLVPVALAMGERHHISGRGVIEAYILGVEIDALLGKMLINSPYHKAWNTSCTIGIAGATATACKLMGASQEDYTNAFGLAVSSVGCVKENYGTSAKDISVGITAFMAIFCSEMANCGIVSNSKIFEGNNGVYAATGVLGTQGDIDRIIREHKSDFLMPGMILKPYPTCRGNHTVLDCFTRLVNGNRITPDMIQKVICKVQQTVLDTDKYPYPTTREQAKFSIRYCIGKILYAKKLLIEDFVGDKPLDAQAVDFMDRVEVLLDCGFDDARFGAEVEIMTTGAQSYSMRCCAASGDPMCPMSSVEIENKWKDCILSKYPLEQADRILAALRDIPSVQDICQLTSQLS
ncbi:MmgE/PrpD family [uncultured Butyricicoccus sp.]|uniref:MmgE/PrpD family protein n=1 Tax=Agathobaculum ammoniilyticum TaxID=2981778 RepID=A0ABT2U6N3_9FIRM|nr:MmgE/PrpD family protein [Agathobaculum ammoniilyticum]MBS6884111.1 MmgE/PrpD family protein [Clostridiaceae bacterium]MCU6790225.1 MmgE/PrpD family protein [Agathobaculum ammoniilyticum]SCJ54802.1 MmgE/PrpD family [uncultured Butyricicoccus sp.]